MPLSSTLRAAALVVTLGTLVQGSIGYGMTLVAAPLLSLVDPTLVPVPLILLTPVHAVLAVARDGRHADWLGIGWATLGRLPGMGIGVLAVVLLRSDCSAASSGSACLLTWCSRASGGSPVFDQARYCWQGSLVG
jgi:uncharacterized protein